MCSEKDTISNQGCVKISHAPDYNKDSNVEGERTRMGLWNKSLEDMLYGYDAELWESYPRHIVQAFFAVDYEDRSFTSLEDDPPYSWPRDEVEVVAEAIEAFAQRRGGLSDETFLRTLQETQGKDRLVSLFAIGYNTLLPAEDLLFPFFGEWRFP